MAQLNFFTPYLKQQKTSPVKYKSIVVFVVFALIVGSFLALQLRIYLIKEKIAENEKTLQSEEMIERVETKRKVDELNKSYEQAKGIVNAVGEIDLVNLKLIKDIMATVPQNMYFQKIKLDKEKWEISGVTNNRQLIAEFQYNLKESGLISKSLVETINNSESSYEFDLIGIFSKGGGSR